MDLELHVEVEKPDGSTIRFAAESDGDRVPQGINFSTKRMEGFDAGGFTIARHVLSESREIELFDTVRFIASDGTVAYEGRVAGLPRQLDDSHSQAVETQGYMAHLRDRKFRQVFVDRELSAWTGLRRERRALMLAGAFHPVNDGTVSSDAVQAAVVTEVPGPWTASPYPLSESWYDIGDGLAVSRLEYEWFKGATVTSGSWTWAAHLDTDDQSVSFQSSGNLNAAGPGSGSLTATTSDRRYAHLAFFFGGAASAFSVTYQVNWNMLAVHGTTGLTRRDVLDDTSATGYYVSDMIRWIVDNHCPHVSSVGVQDTTYPVPHAAFKERTDPYDALLELNKNHLWEAAMWEGPTLHYAPSDLTDYDWEVRTDHPGVQIQWQGDTLDALANGIVVEFTNVVTNEKQVLLPTDHDELRDDSLDHPANRHVTAKWEELALTSPTTLDIALQIGRMKLAEANQPKAPGQFTVAGGTVKDRQGNRRPGWMVRATDAVAITDHPNDTPRLITESRWDNDSKTLTVATDSEIKRVEAFLDRAETALKAERGGGLIPASMPDNGFAQLRERVARLEGDIHEHGRRLDLIEAHARAQDAAADTSRRFALTTAVTSGGLVFTAVSVIAALLR